MGEQWPSGAFHRSASMCTQRRSISAVCGYSSLSIMFLSIDSVHEPVDLGLLPRLAEGGQVLTSIPVEHDLVGDRPESLVGPHLVGREAVGGEADAELPPGVGGVEYL